MTSGASLEATITSLEKSAGEKAAHFAANLASSFIKHLFDNPGNVIKVGIIAGVGLRFKQMDQVSFNLAEAIVDLSSATEKIAKTAEIVASIAMSSAKILSDQKTEYLIAGGILAGGGAIAIAYVYKKVIGIMNPAEVQTTLLKKDPKLLQQNSLLEFVKKLITSQEEKA